MFDLTNKVAVITGGACGIGLAIVQRGSAAAAATITTAAGFASSRSYDAWDALWQLRNDHHRRGQ